MNTLDNAPIVEALAQINYEIGRPVEQSDINTFVKPYSGFTFEDINQVQIAPNVPPVLNFFGYSMSEPKTGEFIQITKQFLAYSQTAKYTDWAKFRISILNTLATFLTVTPVINVNRIALRYNNKISIPYDLHNFGEYMKVFPQLGEVSKFGPESINLQYTMPMSKYDARANVTLRFDQNALDTWIAVLDIDVFKTGNFKPNIDDLMIEFDRLRLAKNEIFKKSLTDAAISTFKN